MVRAAKVRERERETDALAADNARVGSDGVGRPQRAARGGVRGPPGERHAVWESAVLERDPWRGDGRAQGCAAPH